jgi:phosphatidylinositol 4-phosphatase
MGRLKGNMIYKVAATEFLPLREGSLRDPDEEVYLKLLKTLIKTGPMYFSYSYDITNSFQRHSEANPATPLWKRADDRFFWNRFIQSDLIDFRTGKTRFGQHGEQPAVDPFILPVMFGMLRITNTSIKGNPLTFVLITRRSRHRAGTRYFSRGIDENGNVSNFNETEQTIIINDDASKGLISYAGDAGLKNGNIGGREAQVLSYGKTRGSVPVYWAEVNTLHYTPKLQIRGIENATLAAKRHFDEQIRLYGENYLVNLVNQKGREKRVKDAYEQMVRLLVTSSTEDIRSDTRIPGSLETIESKGTKSDFDRLHYVYFDFHNETKGLQWHRAQLLMQQLKGPVIAGGYFRGVDMPGHEGRTEIRSKQDCVVRTNCMDCLDRTNVVQSMLGRFILSRMLIDLGILREGENASDDHAFEHLFRNIWADNADVVSKSYSGTGALKTDFTRTGNRTKRGAFQDFSNSATRYLKNNFADGPRQDGFDLFLGAHLPAPSNSSLFVDKRPLVIQSVPYVLLASLFLVFVGSLTRRDPTAVIWPFRLLMIIALVFGVASGYFIFTHGALYVCRSLSARIVHFTNSQ